MLVVKTIRFLWPFLKEMILGDKTVRQALRTNLGRVLLIAVILLSIVANFFTIPRLLEISYAQVELKRRYEAQSQLCKLPAKPSAPVLVDSGQTASVPATGASDAQYERAKEFFEHLRASEQPPH